MLRLIFFSLVTLFGFNQMGLAQQQIWVENHVHDYGDIENIYNVQSEFIIKNTGVKKLYFLRADVNKNVKVLINKKAIEVGDTTMITVMYTPSSAGKFNEKVNCVTSLGADAFVLQIKGNIKSLKKDDKTACYYFGKPRHGVHNVEPIIIPEKTIVKRNDQIPELPQKLDTLAVDGPGSDVIEPVNVPVQTPVITNPASKKELDRSLYKPNNITFLVDISGSMKDSTKLPLMKIALYNLIDELRDIDKVTFITYADTVIIVEEAILGSNKEVLTSTTQKLKAKGMTKGSKAIMVALDNSLKHYIVEGNNQIILVTDGKFFFSDKNYEMWSQKTGDKQIVLSTLALGNDPKALSNLKDIAKKGKGSFIRIRDRKDAEKAVSEEIKNRSKK